MFTSDRCLLKAWKESGSIICRAYFDDFTEGECFIDEIGWSLRPGPFVTKRFLASSRIGNISDQEIDEYTFECIGRIVRSDGV